MRTVVLGDRPLELEQLIERRRALGLDRFDEVWEGDYHVAPEAHTRHGILDDEISGVLRPYAKRAGLIGTGPFNLGGPTDYRVPDRAFHRTKPTGVYATTAPAVVEILSPDDETFEKFDFYARHGVVEVIVVDPDAREVQCYSLPSKARVSRSDVLGVDMAELTSAVSWP